MTSSTLQNTSEQRWVISIRCIQLGGLPFELTGGKPEWQIMVLFLGVFGLTRSGLSIAGPLGLATEITTYGGCLVTGAIIARCIKNARSQRVSRLWSGTIGLIGANLGVISPELTTSTVTDSAWTRVVAPLGALELMLLIHLAGEVLVRWFPANETTPESTPPSRCSQREGGQRGPGRRGPTRREPDRPELGRPEPGRREPRRREPGRRGPGGRGPGGRGPRGAGSRRNAR
jgi:hypothetical protein